MADKDISEDELRPEYEEGFWKGAVRGKYAQRYAAASNVVRIASDMSTVFPNEESVNEALRKVVAENSSSEDVGQFFRDSDQLSVR